MSFKKIILAVLYVLSTNIYAQSEQKQIRFIDLESGMPIVSATYEYGDQHGTSDVTGLIQFVYSPGISMYLSHVNYGSWTLSDADVISSIATGSYYQASSTIDLYPITIIAMKPPSSKPKGEHQIQYQDRLEHDATEILGQSPSFSSIRKAGNYGFEPVFRGYKYDQLNVVLNGAQGTTAACPNRMDPPTSQMAPNMMERIEILKGPHALRFGTGFGATINFVPTQVDYSDEPTMYGRLSSGYENNGNLLRGESQLGIKGSTYDLSLFASWSQGDDYTTGDDETVQADFTRGSFGAVMGYRLAANQQLRISALYNRARDADFAALPMDLRDDDTWMLSARHDIQFDNRSLQSWNTTLFGSFVDHLMDNRLKPLNPRMMNAETAATTFNIGGRSEGQWRMGQNKLYAGIDLRLEGAEGIRTREFLRGPMAGKIVKDNAWQKGWIAKSGLFSEVQISGQGINYVVSARVEHNTANVNDPSQEFLAVHPDTRITQLNPSLSLGALKEINDRFQAGLWIARAQRSGSLTERFINYFPVGQDPYEMLGNPDLAPEVNYQADMALKWNNHRKSTLQIDLFAGYLRDFISSFIVSGLSPRLPRSPGVRQFTNIDKAMKAGLEASWTQQLAASLAHRASIAYTYGKDLTSSEPLPEIAPLDIRYSLYGSYFDGRLSPQISWRYVTEQSRVSGEFGESITPSFSVLDVKVSYQITDIFSVNLGVKNLLDANYYEHLSRSVRGTNNAIFAPGRSPFVKMNLSF